MTTREEIGRLVAEYGVARAQRGGHVQFAALMSAIDRVLDDRAAKTKRMWELGQECDLLQTRIAALEKALRRRGCEFGINATAPQALTCQCGTCAALSGERDES